MSKKLLIVDDEESVLSTLKRLFRNKDFEIETATSGEMGAEKLKDTSYDLIISDMRMPGMNGAEFLAHARERWPLTERILLTGYSDMESTVKAINDGGIYGYLAKPWKPDQLMALVDNALEKTAKNKLKNKALKTFKKQNESLALDVERKDREMAQSAALVDFAHKHLNEAQERQTREMEQSAQFVDKAYQELQDNYDVIEQTLINLLDLKRKGMRAYSQKVADIALQMSELQGLSESQASTLSRAARLHAIGKIGLSDAILSTPLEALNEEQLEAYRAYPEHGASTLISMAPFQELANLIFQQKQYVDGTGFPEVGSIEDLSSLGNILTLVIDYAEYRFGVVTGRQENHDAAIAFIQRHSSRYNAALLASISSITLEVDQTDQNTEVLLPVHSLKQGMIVREPLYTDSDILLLPEGAVLNNKVINHLMNIDGNSDDALMVSVRLSYNG